MPFDFDLTAICDHIVDGLQYWGFDSMTQEQNYFLQNDSTYRNQFLKKMAYRVCPRCGGKGYYSDIHFEKNKKLVNALSKPVVIRGRTKLIQDLDKFLKTIIGDNIFHHLYGVGYQQYIGTKIVSDTLERLKITTMVALDYTRALYIQQTTYQNVDPSEMFSYASNINVQYDPASPSSFFIAAELFSIADEKLIINYNIDVTVQKTLPEGMKSDVASFTRLG